MSNEWIVELELPQTGEKMRIQFDEPLVLGRHERETATDVDLTPYKAEELGVSRRHVTVFVQNDMLLIRDLGSGNGTVLNGQRLEPERDYPLKHGDRLLLGHLIADLRIVVAPGYGGSLHQQRSIQVDTQVERGQGQFILIVEDDQEVARFLSMLLERSGYSTGVTHDVTSAIRMFRQKKPSAIILDLMLPDINGLEFCRYVRRDAVGGRTPIIVISAAKTPQNVDTAMQAGANIFLGKPMSSKELRHTVSSLIAEHEKGVSNLKTKHLVGTAPLRAIAPDTRRSTAVLFVAGHGDTPITVHVKQQVTLGRSANPGSRSHIDLGRYEAVDMGVSRVHAMLDFKDEHFVLQDAGSVNGTYVNGEPIKPNQSVNLNNSDEIRLGQLRMYIYFLTDTEH